MAEAKIHPPTRSRIAEARAAGIAPRPLFVGLSALSFGLAVCVRMFAPALGADLARLFQAPLSAFAQGRTDVTLALVATPLTGLLETLALCALVMMALVLLGLLLAQGLSFAWPRAGRQRFSAPRASLEAPLLALLAAVTLAVFRMRDALWLDHAHTLDFLAGFLSQLAGVWLVLALIDAAFSRAQFYRALWLTRRELREEQREAYGSPELRSARDTARQRLTHEEP